MRQGAALPAVLLALTMTSALAVGGAFVARQQAAAARFSGSGEALLPAAEMALVQALASWDLAARDSQLIGMSVRLTAVSGRVPTTDLWITRAGPTLFWIVVEARTIVEPVLRRRIGVLVEVSGDTAEMIPLRGWTDLP